MADLRKSSNELGYLQTEVGRPAGGAVCEGYQDVHTDSPAKCVPHPEQSAGHICHRSWAHKAFYSCYDAFFRPKSYDQKGEGKKVHGWECWKYPSEGR